MKKKDIILIVIVGLFLIGSFFLNGNKKEEDTSYSSILERNVLESGKINTMDYNYFNALVNASTENTIVYLGSATCSWCTKFKPILESVVSENGLKVVYIDLSTVTKNEYNKISSICGEHFTGTPTTLIMNGKNIVDSLGGYNEKDAVVTFLTNNGFIS